MIRRSAPTSRRHQHHQHARKRNAAEERLGAQSIYGDKAAVIYSTADGNLRVALVDGGTEQHSWPVARTTEAIREIGMRLRGIREALVARYGADPGPTPAAPPQRPARPRIEEVAGPAWAPPRVTKLELPPNVILYDKNNPSARRVTLDWNSDRGFLVLTDSHALFNLIGTNKLKMWGFSTAKDPRTGQWLPWATRKISAVDSAILALSKSMQITPIALKEFAAWKEQEQVRALAPGKAFRVEPTRNGKGYITVGNVSAYASALTQAGWRESWDRSAFIADSLAPVQAIMASNLGGDIELEPPVAEALARFVRSLADSAVATGETCSALVAPPGKTYLPFQCAGITYAMSRPATLIADEPGLGKAQPIDEPVLTPTGWRAMGNLRVGDLVIGSNGAPTRVTGVYPRGMRAAFRVTTTDGASTRCCDEHLWHVETKNDRSRDTGGRVLTLREIMDKPLKRGAAHQWFVPVPKPIRYAPQAPLPVHPYLLGALLANGGLSTGCVNYSSGDDHAALVEPLLPEGVSFTSADRCTRRITSGQSGAKNVLLDALRDLQLSGLHSYEKFIPAAYLTASVEDRMALLQGLMDNDGTVSADSMTLEYNTTSPALAAGVIELLRSLGAVSWMSTRTPRYEHKGEVREGRQDHRIRMALPDGLAPFRLPRKAARYNGRSKYAPSRAIERIEPCGECEMVCIAVEAPDHLYVTRDFLVTHNTIQAIGYINNRPDITSAIIVAPASLLANWRRELGVWLTRPFNIYVVEDSSESVPAGANIVVVNYEKLIDIGYTERSYGPIEQIHEVVYEGGGFRVRNNVSRVVLPKTFRKQETAAEAAELWDRIGEPMPDGSWRGTRVTFGYWLDRMKGKRPAYYLVDPSWKPARQATDRDVPTPKVTKGTRPSGVFRDLMARRWSLLVIDEVHKIKMSGDKPQKTSVACLGERVYDKAAKREVIRREGLSQRVDRARIYLSGTPMPNRTIEMWPILADLDPVTFNNFFAFAQRYAGAERTRYGWDFSGNTNSAELHDLLRGSVMVRRLKLDVLKELPAKQRQVVTLPVSVLEDAGIDLDDMLDLWDEFEAKAEEVQARMSAAILAADRASYEKAVDELVTLGDKPHFSKMSKMRAAIAVAKVPYVVAHVEELFESGVECVVVMAHHHNVQDALFEAFNKSRPGSAVMHRGGMSLAEKDASVVAFQGSVDGNGRAIPPRPGVRVFVGSILASGVGITLTRSHNIVFAELDWVPGNVSQAEDRVHRIGQTIPVLVQHMIVDQSIDALLINTILEKQAAADRVLDTARLPMELAKQEGSEVATTAEILLADAPAVGGTRQAESSIEQWAIATILEYSRTGVTAIPLSPYDLQIVANVVRFYRFGLTPAKQRAAVGVALKIAGRVPEQVSRTATVRGPSTENEEWAARAILSLAGMDLDMASERNKVGFSASDTSNGHRLEALIAVGGMTDADWRDAVRIARHYKNTQVGAPPEADVSPKKNGRRR